ncbi:MAG: aldehyde ferredoxin oxidoreductase N-terminal domain-containing protein, partial [Elusimicrobiota bacterium]|nr:aldehyde ferredoxin oxidoreductase N-terminal domain-containing protein [Elusimicrobiota bacterium]
MFSGRGYQGKFLRVNLSTGEIQQEVLQDNLVRNFLGGDGFLAYYLYKELKPKINPLSPENKIIIVTGPLTGTLWPTSGRFVMGSKSPLTNFWGESNCGGYFGAELKFAGWDFLIIDGKAKSPVYIEIFNDEIKIRDAKHLW